MNKLSYLTALLCFCALMLAPVSGRAQSANNESEPASKTDERTAQALYEDANGYLGRRYEEFNKQKLAYDPQLEAKTRQEQRDVAARNALTLQKRESLKGEDLYYLGLLQHLAGDAAARQTMQRFLKEVADGEKPQVARNIVVLYSIKSDLVSEAESAVLDYARHQPQNPEDRYKMEFLIADAFSRARQYGPMVAHATQMYEAARTFASTRKNEVFKRDELLLKSAIVLADAYVKSQQHEAAVKLFEDLRRMSLALPSGALYKQATVRLVNLNPSADLAALSTDLTALPKAPPPEIVGTEWIDQQPTKLSALRGKVVLLDFWAFWCGPCRYTFPNLQHWHETYKNKGLVVLGVTNYQGDVQGRPLTEAEELAYLRDFKKRNQLGYGFVIADSHVNDFNYGVFSIPMSFLIDRRGILRFISPGAGDAEIAELGRMIKKVLAEPAVPTNETAVTQGRLTQTSAIKPLRP